MKLGAGETSNSDAAVPTQAPPLSVRKGSDGRYTRKHTSPSKALIAGNLKRSSGALASGTAREMFQQG